MNLGNLRDMYRQIVKDQVSPYLWDDSEIDEYANDAQREACRRAKLLVDATSYSIIINSGDSGFYDLAPEILYVKRFKLASKTVPTPVISYRDLDLNYPGWETVSGSIVNYCPDIQTGQLRVVNLPIASDTAYLTVVRLPKVDMVYDDDVPEIPLRYHRALMNWMLHRGYSKQDTETADPTKAEFYKTQFETEFGPPSVAKDEMKLIITGMDADNSGA